MAKIARVLKGDPATIAVAITSYLGTETLEDIQKTQSSGEFVAIFDDAASIGQTAVVVKGDPATVAQEISALVVGSTKVVVTDTFSASSYVLVYD